MFVTVYYQLLAGNHVVLVRRGDDELLYGHLDTLGPIFLLGARRYRRRQTREERFTHGILLICDL